MCNIILLSLEPVQGMRAWKQACWSVRLSKLQLGFAHLNYPTSIMSVGVGQFTSKHLKSIFLFFSSFFFLMYMYFYYVCGTLCGTSNLYHYTSMYLVCFCIKLKDTVQHSGKLLAFQLLMRLTAPEELQMFIWIFLLTFWIYLSFL